MQSTKRPSLRAKASWSRIVGESSLIALTSSTLKSACPPAKEDLEPKWRWVIITVIIIIIIAIIIMFSSPIACATPFSLSMVQGRHGLGTSTRP